MSTFNKKIIVADQSSIKKTNNTNITSLPPVESSTDNAVAGPEVSKVLWRPIFKNILKTISCKVLDFLAIKTNSIFLNILSINYSFHALPGYDSLIIDNLINSMNKKSLFYPIYNKYILKKTLNTYSLYSKNKINETEYLKTLETLRNIYLRNKEYKKALEICNKILYLNLYEEEKATLFFNIDIIKAVISTNPEEQMELIFSFINDHKKNSRYISLIYAAKIFFSNNFKNSEINDYLISNLNSGKSLEGFLSLIQQLKPGKINIKLLDHNLFHGTNIGLNTKTENDTNDLKIILNNIVFSTDTDEINTLLSLLFNLFNKDLFLVKDITKLVNKYSHLQYTSLQNYLFVLVKFFKKTNYFNV